MVRRLSLLTWTPLIARVVLVLVHRLPSLLILVRVPVRARTLVPTLLTVAWAPLVQARSLARWARVVSPPVLVVGSSPLSLTHPPMLESRVLTSVSLVVPRWSPPSLLLMMKWLVLRSLTPVGTALSLLLTVPTCLPILVRCLPRVASPVNCLEVPCRLVMRKCRVRKLPW